MLPFVGAEYQAQIVSVTSFGFFVRLENTVEGLVHISTLVDDYYNYDADSLSLIGEHSGPQLQARAESRRRPRRREYEG